MPRIVARRERRLSPWFTTVEKDVVFAWSVGQQTYYSFSSLHYVKVYALTQSMRVPLITSLSHIGAIYLARA